MLGNLILEQSLPEAQPAVVSRQGTATWGEIRKQAQSALQTLSGLAKRRVGISLHATAESYAAFAALDKLECDVFLIDSRLASEEMLALAERLRLGAVLSCGESEGVPKIKVRELPNEEKWSGASSLTILTSGSTGEPKAARHSWESIARPVRKSSLVAPRWLLAYRPHLYAGLQVMLQCFANLGTLVVPEFDADPQATAQLMCDAGVQFVSATPSYWRRLLMFADRDVMRKVPLLQITLGGEVVDQQVGSSRVDLQACKLEYSIVSPK